MSKTLKIQFRSILFVCSMFNIFEINKKNIICNKEDIYFPDGILKGCNLQSSVQVILMLKNVGEYYNQDDGRQFKLIALLSFYEIYFI